jgi:hypothetical protein
MYFFMGKNGLTLNAKNSWLTCETSWPRGSAVSKHKGPIGLTQHGEGGQRSVGLEKHPGSISIQA